MSRGAAASAARRRLAAFAQKALEEHLRDAAGKVGLVPRHCFDGLEQVRVGVGLGDITQSARGKELMDQRLVLRRG